MLENILYVILVGVILWALWYGAGKFYGGEPHKITGIVLGIIWLIFSLRILGVIDGHLLR